MTCGDGPPKKRSGDPPEKTIFSISSINRFFGVTTGTRKAEIEAMDDLAKKQNAGRLRESLKRRFKLPNPTGKWRLMGIDISRAKISIGFLARICAIPVVAERCALSREGVVSSHSVAATGLVSRHRVEFCTSCSFSSSCAVGQAAHKQLCCWAGSSYVALVLLGRQLISSFCAVGQAAHTQLLCCWAGSS